MFKSYNQVTERESEARFISDIKGNKLFGSMIRFTQSIIYQLTSQPVIPGPRSRGFYQ